MELTEKLDEIVAHIEGARSVPMSASCIVNRAQLLAMLDELRELLPEELRRAQHILAERDQVIAEGRREAERIIEEALRERAQLVAESEIHRAAAEEAERLLDEARREAGEMRREVDDYIDTRLANFEIVLNKTLAAVLRGREKLHGKGELSGLTETTDDPPL
ncbi:MAG: hypothetical protein IRZ27_07530 [Acidothermus cellulolyticus]|nr:hypothetical protein [Acidothermus cellulolyticus]MCL6550888.1 hypothetical protein [Acidothermus cellulolyticus]